MKKYLGDKRIIYMYLGDNRIIIDDSDSVPVSNLFNISNVKKGRYSDIDSVSTLRIIPCFTRSKKGVKIVNPTNRTIIILKINEIPVNTSGVYDATELINSSLSEIIYYFEDDVINFGIEFKRRSSGESGFNSSYLENEFYEIYEID